MVGDISARIVPMFLECRKHQEVVWLVVSTCFNPSEKYEFVSWDHYSQYMEK